MIRTSLLLSLIAFGTPCFAVTLSVPELVLQENAELSATTPSGRISIKAGRKLDRTYSWGRCKLNSDMRPRPSRWFGSLGIYDPASSYLFLSTVLPWWFKCDGVSRTVVQEGQIHFQTQSDAEHWLTRYAEPSTTVWTHDGLLIRWDIIKDREQVNVDLWQICIAGQRPSALSGAHDKAVTVTADDTSRSSRRECASASETDIRETQQQWTEFWKEIDQWRSKK